MTDPYIIEVQEPGQRLDTFLQEQLEEVSRSRIRKWIDEGNVTVNGSVQKAGYKLRIHDQILIEEPEPEELMTAAPEPMDLDIVYEDPDLAIVNKPK